MTKTKTRASVPLVQTVSARRIRSAEQVQQQPRRSAEALWDRTNPNTPAWARQKKLAPTAAAIAGTKAGHATPHARVTVYLLEPPLDPPAAAAAALSAAFCCFNRIISASLRQQNEKGRSNNKGKGHENEGGTTQTRRPADVASPRRPTARGRSTEGALVRIKTKYTDTTRSDASRPSQKHTRHTRCGITYFSFLFVSSCLALGPSASFFLFLPPFSALLAARCRSISRWLPPAGDHTNATSQTKERQPATPSMLTTTNKYDRPCAQDALQSPARGATKVTQ